MKPLQIGITGGIGSGKSLVCRIFQCLGIPVYDADSHAKKVMTTDGILISQIKKEFGELAYHSDGSINRRLLSEEVFPKPARLKVLNALVHPRVATDYEKWINEHLQFPYVIKEAALLFESGANRSLDWIIVISAPEEIRIQRVLRRDKGRTIEQVNDIIAQQWGEEEKVKRANSVIKNDGSQLIVKQVIHLHEIFSEGNLPDQKSTNSKALF